MISFFVKTICILAKWSKRLAISISTQNPAIRIALMDSVVFLFRVFVIYKRGRVCYNNNAIMSEVYAKIEVRQLPVR